MKIYGNNWEDNYFKNDGLLIAQNAWEQEEVFTYMGNYGNAVNEQRANYILGEIELLEKSGNLTAAVDKNGDGEVTGSEIDAFCKNAGSGNFVDSETRSRIANGAKNEAKANNQNKITTGTTNNIAPDFKTGAIGQSPLTALNKTLTNIGDNDPKIVEIKNQITEKQGELTGYQEELAAINNGTDSEITSLKQAEEEAYQAYQDKMQKCEDAFDMVGGLLGGSTPAKIDEKKGEVEAKQTEIDSKSTEISAQEGVVSSCETEVANAESNVENCQANVTALKGQLSSLSDEDKEAANSIRFQISLAENALGQAKAEKAAADKALETAEKKLQDLNKEKTELEKEHTELENELQELQDEFEEKHPEVAEARKAWENAKEETETRKSEKAAEVQGKINTAQSELNDLETQLQEAQEAKQNQIMGTNNLGDDIIDFAEGFLGKNEADGSADMFLEETKADNTVNDPNGNYKSSSTHWCAAYVEYIMENNSSADNVAGWYQDIGNKWYCPTIYQAATENNAVIAGSEAQKGDIVLFDWQANGGEKDHIGIYAGIEGDKAVIIEGNTGNAKVEKRYYDLDDPRLTYCSIHA